MDSLTRSAVFTKMNQLRGQGAEKKRLYKALGHVQRGDERPYETTPTSCTCADHVYRGATCYHMLAAKMAAEAQQAQAEQEPDDDPLPPLPSGVPCPYECGECDQCREYERAHSADDDPAGDDVDIDEINDLLYG